MLNRILQHKVLAIGWLLIITILFFLPGSALPKDDLFGLPYFDKLIHACFFAVLLFLWRFAFPPGFCYNLLLFLLGFLYGSGVELVQHFFIPNRSFDQFDIVADMVGALTGVWCWQWYKKNRPL